MNPVSSPSFIQPAERIASFKPYFFASLTQKLNALKAKGMDIIRLDMGSPDLPPADFIIDALAKAAHRPDMHGYTPMGGTLDYKKACAEYYLRRFGIELDPQKEVLALLGSKEGLFNLCQVLLNPGDVSLVPDPGYPVYSAGSIIAGAEMVYHAAAGGKWLSARPEQHSGRCRPPRQNPVAQLSQQPHRCGGPASPSSKKLLPLPANMRSSSPTTRPMWMYASTAMTPPASCKCRAQKMWRLNSTRCPKPTTWPAGAWVWLLEMPG